MPTRSRSVLDSWQKAVELADIRARQTGWKYRVRRIPLTSSYGIERTTTRVRHRPCNPARERELGRHAT